ncbi:hypothetical protein [Fusibacter bizertensis]
MKKKIMGMFLCVTLVLASISTVYAAVDQSGKSLDGYVYLYGAINSSGYGITSVRSNPDNAYLTLSAEFQNVSGVTLANPSYTSSRGVTELPIDDVGGYYLPAGVKHQFSSHGVQGGTSYNAGAVYTYTSIGL